MVRLMLLFKPQHQVPILMGLKTETRRIWKRQRAKVGSIHKAKLKMLSRDYFAKLKIMEVRYERLGEMTDTDAKAEGYESLRDFKLVWLTINGEWDVNQNVYVVKFERVYHEKN